MAYQKITHQNHYQITNLNQQPHHHPNPQPYHHQQLENQKQKQPAKIVALPGHASTTGFLFMLDHPHEVRQRGR